MENPPKKVRYIFPIILILGFVSLLFLLRSFATKIFLIHTYKNPIIVNTYKFSVFDESSLETKIFDEINRKRLELDNDPLKWDERIYQAA